MKQSVEALENIDGAFNNAGIGIDTLPLEAVEEAEFDRIVSINMKGVWLCMKSQLTHMKANGGGAIVNNASVAGLVGLAMQGAYSGTKHAVIGMTKAAAAEAATEQVRVNAICPGATRTPILTHLLEAGVSEGMAYLAVTDDGEIDHLLDEQELQGQEFETITGETICHEAFVAAHLSVLPAAPLITSLSMCPARPAWIDRAQA